MTQGLQIGSFNATPQNPLINQLAVLLGQKILSMFPQHIQSPIPQQYMVNSQTKQQMLPTMTPTPTPQYDPNIFKGYVMTTPNQYIPYINAAARQYKVPTNMLSGVLANESMRWNPDVISGKIKSPAGAIGVAQFMPDVAKSMGIDPLNVQQSIMGAGRKLGSYLKQYGNPDTAMAAYNAGPGAVAQYGGTPPYQETQNYIKNINQDMNHTFGNPDYYKQ